MTEIVIRDTDGPQRFVLTGLDANGNSTGPLPDGCTGTAASSDTGIVQGSIGDHSVLVLDPFTPGNLGTVTVTLTVTTPDGTVLNPNTVTVHVVSGVPVGVDVDPTPL